jgi:hypothetical protein
MGQDRRGRRSEKRARFVRQLLKAEVTELLGREKSEGRGTKLRLWDLSRQGTKKIVRYLRVAEVLLLRRLVMEQGRHSQCPRTALRMTAAARSASDSCEKPKTAE